VHVDWAVLRKAITTIAVQHGVLRMAARQRRWLVLTVAAAVCAVLIVWALPSLLTRHPRVVDAAARHTAIANTRTGLVGTLAVLGAAAGLTFTYRTYQLSREGHITDRYTKAVDQLGETEKLAVRLGGIYALASILGGCSP
jgi:hypothetical protein